MTFDPDAPIGIARLLEDGTIEMKLMATSASGINGDALIRVRPDEERYARTLAHLGLVEAGDSAPVRPFPQSDDDGYDWS